MQWAVTRKAIHAYLSPEAHQTWHDYAAEHGVSVSGLLEAIATDWAERAERGEHVYDGDDPLVRKARRVDADRRRRKRD
jgi:hypothetical protein